ncbi:hypothetical protein PMI35_03902 [Pseudomonas sp. GM78]|uniref:NEL-type E3 ubiquitin ligase domain-containing protein n=1 Tax=Pseudomonas sp. GM78 TaxID=1144337 RepID=UPI00027059EE|nr:NEL-type E3 ubiquitin ligase domain-containing protein [Pseudomonas sp. GM78]EJN26060.1 hypothetical protein PMI35_03902 [Pseudomonas sp. GM78]
MLATTSKTATAAEPLTSAQRLEALLEHTGDLDKAQVLKASIAPWLATADLTVVQALKAAFEQSFETQGKVTEALKKLKPLDEFCKEQLTEFLKGKWTVDFDVERDMLDITKTLYTSTGALPVLGYPDQKTTTSRSLLQAAMENFTSGEAGSGGFPAESVIRINEQAQSDAEITPVKFAALCRELDLGARYQRHIDQALALPAKPAKDAPVDDRASVADIRRLKVLDMRVALHMASLKKDITPAVYTMLLSVIDQDLPAAQTRGASFDGGPVQWQGLMIHDTCICGALVFTKVSIDTEPKARCVVYMPNEPRRPLYEYASLDDFKVYLTLHLQSKSYRKSFAGQYLHGHDKTGFFTGFDKGKTLGTLAAAPADTCLGDFFFSTFVSTTQKDAQMLAVPTEDVDEQQREKNLQALIDGGLVLLNAAAFFVPVIGQLMLAAAVVDIVSEVYEGVVDWTHGERAEALTHLLSVVENVAQLAAFAVGGKIIAKAIGKGAKEQEAFFDEFEAVTHADGTAKLWKPNLDAYKQTTALPIDAQPDAQGLYRHAGQTSIVIEGAPYRVTQSAEGSPWTLNHSVRTDAFAPAVERNVEGGWRHVYEHAHEWRDGAYALERTNPRLGDLGDDLEAIADITDMTPDKLHRLHESNLKLPQRLNDCVERFRIDRRITTMVAAMEGGESANKDFIQEQLHTLPRLPGWPTERFIEVRDGEDLVVSRFPETAPHDDDVNSVHVLQSELDSGKLLDTVINGLYPTEVEGIIGKTTIESKSQLLAKKIATSLKSGRQPLFEWLYKTWDGTATGDLALLREHTADLPTRVCEELLDNASASDRSFLRDRKILGMDLAVQVSEAQAQIRQDRALTGLHLPRLANADTDKLSLGLMERVQGWDGSCRLEVRQGSATGTLLDSVGEMDAQSLGIIVKTPTGYQVTQTAGNVSSTLTSDTLLGSILDALPTTQRTRMSLTGEDPLDVPTLRARLSRAAAGDPVRTGRVLRGERSDTPKHLFACVQADSPAANSYARGLIRKVKKLYPLFTDAQASAFLDSAGSTQMQRVNRIKELEQQLKKLRGVLHTWRDDKVAIAEAVEKLPGNENDIRVSRRQVANTIEKCWRRIARSTRTSTMLRLERNPVGPLPTLTEQDVAHVRSLSITEMKAGDELAYFLAPFKGLVTLNLDHNNLKRLPEALSYMPDLEQLSLQGNQIQLTEYTLRKLADMHKLRSLGLSDNNLGATVDVSKMINLKELLLRDTHATELPVGLQHVLDLDFVDLRGNNIVELPEWLFNLRQRNALSINLSGNPVSARSRARLGTFHSNTGIGMGLWQNETVVVHDQRARDLWMPKPAEATYARRNGVWLALKENPESKAFFELLAQLGSSADSRFVHENMTWRVWSVMEATRSDEALCRLLLKMAATARCADDAASLFSNIEVAVEIEKEVRLSANAHDKAARLLRLGRRLFRQDYLAKIAKERVEANPALDDVEVELAYCTGLADRLELIGQPRHMRFELVSGVNANDLDAAYNKVITAELSPELLTSLIERSFWSDFLRAHHGEKFSEMIAPFQVREQTASENEAKLGEDYGPTLDRIDADMKTAEHDLLKGLTQAAMDADAARTCFTLD